MKVQTKNPALRGRLGFDNSNIDNIDDTSLPAQRQRLLCWLRAKSITTIEARSALNILAPAARIWELRHKENLNIVTNWVNDVTTEGKQHSVGQYTLLTGKWHSSQEVKK